MPSTSRYLVRLLAVPLLAGCEAATANGQLPLTTFQYDRAEDLAVAATVVSDGPAVRVSRVSFSSSGSRVTGMLAAPVAAGRYAGVVLMHGLPGTALGAMNGFGIEIAGRGAVVLAVDAPWVRRNGLPDFSPRDSIEQVQLIVDLQRAVDVLLSRSDVDPARLAYVGGSYGGAMGSLFAGIERRLKAFVLFVPDGGLVAHFTASNGTPLGPLASLEPSTRERWLAAMQPIEPILFIHRAAPAALLFQNGRQDQLVANDDAAALHAAASEPKQVLWYDAGHGLNPQARADRLAWLVNRVGLTP